jgi:hypothetical protein
MDDEDPLKCTGSNAPREGLNKLSSDGRPSVGQYFQCFRAEVDSIVHFVATRGRFWRLVGVFPRLTDAPFLRDSATFVASSKGCSVRTGSVFVPCSWQDP